LAVLLGVAVGTAVLTGALLVGDSLRGSLRDVTEQRLGWIEQAMISPRFVREELATQLAADHVVPAILLQGSASTVPHEVSSRAARTVGRVTIWGVREDFWMHPRREADADFWNSTTPEVVLNFSLANELRAKSGDTISLRFQ